MSSLLRLLLGALDSDESGVVAGDLLEAHESRAASIFQVFYLIVRRQLIDWAGWRCWLVLTTVVFPLAGLLSQSARNFAGWSAVSCWMLIDNTDATLLRSAGFWNGAQEASWTVGRFAFMLFCCSWACGRLIAHVSRKTRLSMAVLFAIASFCFNIVGAPSHARAAILRTNDKYFPNGAVFTDSFYREYFPLIVYATVVLVPFLWGIFQIRPGARRSKVPDILFACSIAFVLVGLIEQRWLLMELWSWQIIPAGLGHLPDLLPFASVAAACLLLFERWTRSPPAELAR